MNSNARLEPHHLAIQSEDLSHYTLGVTDIDEPAKVDTNRHTIFDLQNILSSQDQVPEKHVAHVVSGNFSLFFRDERFQLGPKNLIGDDHRRSYSNVVVQQPRSFQSFILTSPS